ncbi:unnamed protein product [Camellia sinensis]
MELEDVESDLQALRKLYGLLQSNGNGSQSESLEYLDEKARVVLKNLLDGATERVFEAHSKDCSWKLSWVYTIYCLLFNWRN